MATFFQDLWDSIFTPGPTPSLLLATNATFACLQLVLAVLLVATYSVHFVVLSGLSAALWWAVNWFARELKASQRAEDGQTPAAAQQQQQPQQLQSEDSETEVEGEAAGAAGGRQPKPRAARTKVKPGQEAEAGVEAVEQRGDLKHRAAAASSGDEGSALLSAAGGGASQGTKSSVSTEDEWEKVSENENEKDK